MSLSAIHMERFTAFHKLRVNFSPGLNVFVGGNGTGKTHLMKVAYSACDITKSDMGFAEKLIRVFLPSDRALGRLRTARSFELNFIMAEGTENMRHGQQGIQTPSGCHRFPPAFRAHRPEDNRSIL